MSLNIEIKTIPHSEQRYDTCGDWLTINQALQIRVSELSNWKYEFLVGLHELIETALCQERNIPEQIVDKFDFNFEGEGEPGDDPKAPYYRQHQIATGIERLWRRN